MRGAISNKKIHGCPSFFTKHGPHGDKRWTGPLHCIIFIPLGVKPWTPFGSTKVFTPMILTRKVRFQGEHQVGPRSSLEGRHPYIPWTAQCLGWPFMGGWGVGFGSWMVKRCGVVIWYFFFLRTCFFFWLVFDSKKNLNSMSTPDFIAYLVKQRCVKRFWGFGWSRWDWANPGFTHETSSGGPMKSQGTTKSQQVHPRN